MTAVVAAAVPAPSFRITPQWAIEGLGENDYWLKARAHTSFGQCETKEKKNAVSSWLLDKWKTINQNVNAIVIQFTHPRTVRIQFCNTILRVEWTPHFAQTTSTNCLAWNSRRDKLRAICAHKFRWNCSVCVLYVMPVGGVTNGVIQYVLSNFSIALTNSVNIKIELNAFGRVNENCYHRPSAISGKRLNDWTTAQAKQWALIWMVDKKNVYLRVRRICSTEIAHSVHNKVHQSNQSHHNH